MKALSLTIDLPHYWHAGSGLGRGGDADALVLRTAGGLPFLPARTIKGLLRDACWQAESFGQVAAGETDKWFGPRDPQGERDNRDAATPHPSEFRRRPHGELRFECGFLPEEVQAWLIGTGKDCRPALFDSISSAAMEADGPMTGTARTGSLRTIELTLPVTLLSKVTGPSEGKWVETLRLAVKLVRSLGADRHRGLGRCEISAGAVVPIADGTSRAALQTGRDQWFEIELLSDVVLSATAATLGGHDSLDFLPGSALLGAAVAAYRRRGHAFDPGVFLTGQLRFEDGLPLAEDGQIGWPAPLSFQHEKQAGIYGPVVNGLTETVADAEKRRQTKQLRGGYVTNSGRRFHVRRDFVLKTAIDAGAGGQPGEGQLFGYTTLAAGQKFITCLRWQPGVDQAASEIIGSLTGNGIRLGRSRSAQYGRVGIRHLTAEHIPVPPKMFKPVALPNHQAPLANRRPDSQPGYLVIYLASDLALLDNDRSVLLPGPADFGLPEEAELVRDRSFVRTRRYSPWNDFHDGRMAERQVLTRGSVLVFHAPSTDPVELQRKLRSGAGEHRHEGLGAVLVNPEFVLALSELTCFEPAKTGAPLAASEPPPNAAQSPLGRLLLQRRDKSEVSLVALRLGVVWGQRWLKMHRSARHRAGTSQWNQVGRLAVAARGNMDWLETELQAFCTATLRQRFWNSKDGLGPSLFAEILACLKLEPEKLGDHVQAVAGIQSRPAARAALATAALAAGIEHVVRALQTERGKDQR
ncbi:MAG TPA: RAMP superfamily CRISPR-associated protein [Verrucomicrobiae bacterium]|nr:RAMP superfamily CRISPR-associated protein [Verrucomicrobiae bacterium]